MTDNSREPFKKEYKYSFKNPMISLSSLTVFRTGFQKCAKNYHRGTEIRDFFLIHYVIRGKGTLFIEGKPFAVNPGESFIIFPGVSIDYRADREEPWEFCWVGFNGSDAKLLVRASGFSLSNPVLHHKKPDVVFDCLSRIYDARGNDNHSVVEMSAYLYLLFSRLIEESPDIAVNGGMEQVQSACEFISKNYTKSISIEDIAADINVSRSMLYRLFMEYMKVSPKTYLMEYRIRMATKLLSKTEESIKEIASSIGFPNPQHFAVVFRKHIGLSPTEYRLQMAEKAESL